jgi:DNA-binding response OmpR family regulator
MIEDDDNFGAAVERHLISVGHTVQWVRTAADVVAALGQADFDAALLDLGLPDGSGEAVLRQVRSSLPSLPVVVMTARGAIHDRVQLPDIGADDYLVKPFDLDELTARLRSVTRRKRSSPKTQEIELLHGPLKIQPSRRLVTWHGEPVQLTNKEFLLLEYLVRRKNQVLTRPQLEATLFSDGDEIGSNALEVYVHFLRRKFRSSLIQTVRGVGYQLGEATLFDDIKSR